MALKSQKHVLYWYHPKSKKPHRADWWGFLRVARRRKCWTFFVETV
uniref:Uncharacterized protein n=1 Tax=Siphoviridae sp. ctM7c3 TaxID=2826257 RepID=A0A8S5LZP4_9CAUD|nr:MAG TPA: hypothetical protein [Siphoviridae sp. ctM7c3]